MNNKILIVDNEKLIRKLHRSILEHAGYEVIEAEDGKQAICNRTQRPARFIASVYYGIIRADIKGR